MDGMGWDSNGGTTLSTSLYIPRYLTTYLHSYLSTFTVAVLSVRTVCVCVCVLWTGPEKKMSCNVHQIKTKIEFTSKPAARHDLT